MLWIDSEEQVLPLLRRPCQQALRSLVDIGAVAHGLRTNVPVVNGGGGGDRRVASGP